MLQVVPSVPYSATERIRARPNRPVPAVSPGKEVIMAWAPDTQIRPGDLVLVEHSGYGYPATDVLEAQAGIWGLQLAACDGWAIPIQPGDRVIYRGDLEIIIQGIARGSYLAF